MEGKMKNPEWFNKLKPYAKPDPYRSFLYAASSIVPYLLLLGIMFLLLMSGYPYWMVLSVSLLAAGFYIRTFMILHDCSHSSFVRSDKTSSILGHVCGVLTFTPFYDWQKSHGIHHASVANLDKRGTGDVWTMTLKEYRDAGKWKRLLYRLFRNPFFLFVFAPIFLFLIVYRFPQESTRKKELFSIIITDSVLIMIIVAAYFTVGIKNYIAVQLPVLFIATSAGMWLFYVQHQFENVYWARKEDWTLSRAALEGSSYYKLPGVLRWFSGYIGYHTLHHLNPRIPCYNLKNCYNNVPDLHETVPVTLLTGLRSLRLHLWDEDAGRLISFTEAGHKIKS